MSDQLQVTTVRPQVSLSIYDDMTDFTVMSPRDYQAGNADAVLTAVERYARALRLLRDAAPDS
ncbi:MAG: hypothetical protein L0G22_03425 [Propionibacteriaceae bacterium]|nr:hypothetical protein [Propionibacteriaceae bacterium]